MCIRDSCYTVYVRVAFLHLSTFPNLFFPNHICKFFPTFSPLFPFTGVVVEGTESSELRRSVYRVSWGWDMMQDKFGSNSVGSLVVVGHYQDLLVLPMELEHQSALP